ncbi:MAG TPA: hypothetical protein VKA57_00925 [Solirubrobacteraceae bacterium]|nr:hypothetical protein [Solirubrobacteraceae bacterium]
MDPEELEHEFGASVGGGLSAGNGFIEEGPQCGGASAEAPDPRCGAAWVLANGGIQGEGQMSRRFAAAPVNAGRPRFLPGCAALTAYVAPSTPVGRGFCR